MPFVCLGQLIRVNDPHENATWVYNYDRGGNILSKVRYAYTTGALGTAVETIPYAYSDSNWKDKLTAYNGTAITYDAIGNPLNDGAWTYEWQAGRQLKRMSRDGQALTFKYDHNGMRIQKVLGHDWYPETTNYTYHGKLLTHMEAEYYDFDEVEHTDKLHFFYDAQSRPMKISYNSVIYTYVHNLQGDIVGILDSTGALVVEYKYDAWGKLLSTTGSLADTLGKRNPFRYRGYVYDEESELYYLRSRYYASFINRCISADLFVMPEKDLRNSNMYSYCRNMVTCGIDPDGTKWWQAVLNWAAEKIVEPIVNGVESLIGDVDMTITLGFSITASIGFWTYSASVGISMDFEGNIGVHGSVAAGLTTGDVSLGVAGFVTVTNAPTVHALEGDSTQIGATAAFGPRASVDAVMFESDGNEYYGVSVGIGAATPKLEGHATIAHTFRGIYSDSKSSMVPSNKTVLPVPIPKKGVSRVARGCGLGRYRTCVAVRM